MTCTVDITPSGRLAAKRGILLAFSAAFAIGTFVTIAHADDRGRDHRGGGHPDFHGHPGYGGGYGGGYYPPPPVAYGGPYYPPPPVVYGPGVGFNLPGVNINVR